MTTLFSSTYAHDHVAHPGLSIEKLERFLLDVRNQPAWRREADIEAEFYDGNQLDASTVADMEERGIPALITNLIRPAIDVVLGMEAKTRTDWRVLGEGDQDTELAEAMSVKLKEAERLSDVDRAVSDAFAGQVKVGIGWVEVAKESDPFKPKYRVDFVHRRELWWDWRARKADLSDGRYMIRRRWLDEDQLIVMFPKFQRLIKNVMSGWSGWEGSLLEHTTGISSDDTLLLREWEIERDWSIEESEWRDTERRRLAAYEVWYRVWVRSKVMTLPSGRVVEYDKKNFRHVRAVATGMVQLKVATFSKVRLSWWIGPHRVADIKTPYSHNLFPYVPFFGYREDRTGIPFGLIRSMKSPQQEFNARRAKLMWILSAKRTIIDADALDDGDHESVMMEIGRPDAYIKLNPHRQNKDAIRIDTDFGLANQQFEVMLDAKQNIQDAGGIYQSMMGKNETGASSGVAINSLIEQGTTTLTEVYDNYRSGRRQVGDMLLALIQDDIGDVEETIRVGRDSDRPRDITINQLVQSDIGMEYRTNDVTRLRAKVVLDDVPSTPTYRAQQSYLLTELTKSLPPELQTAIVDMIIESTDLPKRKEIADRIRKVTGATRKQDIEEMTEEERQEFEARKQQEAVQAEIQKRDILSQIAEREASAQEKMANIELNTSKISQQADAAERMVVIKAQMDEEADARQAEIEQDVERLKGDIELAKVDIKADTDLKKEKIKAVVDMQLERMKNHEAAHDRDHELKLKSLDSSEAGKDREAEKHRMTEEHKKADAETEKHDKAEKAASKEVKAEPVVPVINISVDATQGPVKKTINVTGRDKAGRIQTAEMTEESTKPKKGKK